MIEHKVRFTISILFLILLIVFIIYLLPCFKNVKGATDCAIGALLNTYKILCAGVGLGKTDCGFVAGSTASILLGGYLRKRFAERRNLRVQERAKKAELESLENDRKKGTDPQEAEQNAKDAAENEKKIANKELAEEDAKELKENPVTRQAINDHTSSQVGEDVVDNVKQNLKTETDGVLTSEEAEVVSSASTIEADAGMDIVGAAAEGAFALGSALAGVGIAIAAVELTKFIVKSFKYCPCGWTLHTTVLPICYKDTCADEFGDGYREAPGSSGSGCIKCPKGYTDMGFTCTNWKTWKTVSNHYKVRKTHSALVSNPDCPSSPDNGKPSQKSTIKDYAKYTLFILVLLFFLFLFGYGIKSSFTPELIKS